MGAAAPSDFLGGMAMDGWVEMVWMYEANVFDCD